MSTSMILSGFLWEKPWYKKNEGGNLIIMFSKRRSELEIVRNILKILQYGAKKTEILYKNNMSFVQLNNYLNILLEKDIIRLEEQIEDNNQRNTLYTTTKKGENLLEEINSIMNYFK